MMDIQTPAARNSDPATSHDAADHINATGKRKAQQSIAAKAVEMYPGLTSLELARKARCDRYMLARRLPECETASAVLRGPARTCSISLRQAVTWYPPGSRFQRELFGSQA